VRPPLIAAQPAIQKPGRALLNWAPALAHLTTAPSRANRTFGSKRTLLFTRAHTKCKMDVSPSERADPGGSVRAQDHHRFWDWRRHLQRRSFVLPGLAIVMVVSLGSMPTSYGRSAHLSQSRLAGHMLTIRARTSAAALSVSYARRSSALTPLTAQFAFLPPSLSALGTSPIFHIGMFRFDQQQTGPALSLSETQRLNPATTWSAVDPNSTQLPGLRPALWIVEHAQDNGSALSDPNQEVAAEQAAVWAWTSGFQLNFSNIPNIVILDRAIQLYEQASQQYQPTKFAYALGVKPQKRTLARQP
jgi:hypothetical protein